MGLSLVTQGATADIAADSGATAPTVISQGNVAVHSDTGTAQVQNQAGGAIKGATTGLYVYGGATVTNAGAIGGGTDAIVFAGALAQPAARHTLCRVGAGLGQPAARWGLSCAS